MNKILILLSLFFLSCDGDICKDSDFTTKHGICVYTNGFKVSQSSIERIIDIVQDELINYHHKYTLESTQKTYDDNQIAIIFSELIHSDPSLRGFCDYYDHKFEISVIKNNCITMSALSHELLHMFLIAIDQDPTHRLGFFAPILPTDLSLIQTINIRAICEVETCSLIDPKALGDLCE